MKGPDITKYMCHRRPDRTFSYNGHYFPVCARCTGFYTGLFIFEIYTLLNNVNISFLLFLLSLVLILPAFIDGFTQFLGLRESFNSLRFVSGFIGGIGLIIALTYFFKTLLILVNLINP